jgi:proteic killer suppression protein
VIQSIRNKGLRRLYEHDELRGIRTEHGERLRDILARLDAASGVEDMNVPGFHLHALRGDLRGFWADTVRANWRVIFRFESGTVLDVDYLDYH